MRIAVLSDCRVPTVPVGGHGLARVAIDYAAGFVRFGHDVTLYAGPGSKAPAGVTLVEHADELERVGLLDAGAADVWLDLSHYHVLSRRKEFKQVHYICDDECLHEPHNAVVGAEFRKRMWPAARVVPLGIDVDAIPLGSGGDHLLFVAKVERRKGPDLAVDVAKDARRALHVYGELFTNDAPPDGYKGVINDNGELYRVLGGGYAFLAPYRDDAGGRVLLEAQAAGTPVLTFSDVGSSAHVGHAVSGFVVRDPAEMVEALADVPYLKRTDARAWVADNHGMNVMIGGMLELLNRAADGEVWG